jgi:hypothetical protein
MDPPASLAHHPARRTLNGLAPRCAHHQRRSCLCNWGCCCCWRLGAHLHRTRSAAAAAAAAAAIQPDRDRPARLARVLLQARCHTRPAAAATAAAVPAGLQAALLLLHDQLLLLL